MPVAALSAEVVGEDLGAAPTFRMLPGLLRVVVLRGEEEEEQDMITATENVTTRCTMAVVASAWQRLASDQSFCTNVPTPFLMRTSWGFEYAVEPGGFSLMPATFSEPPHQFELSGGFFSILPLTVSMLLSWGFESPYEFSEPEAVFSSVATSDSISEMGSCESGWNGADEFGPNESLRQKKNRAGGGMAGRGRGGTGSASGYAGRRAPPPCRPARPPPRPAPAAASSPGDASRGGSWRAALPP